MQYFMQIGFFLSILLGRIACFRCIITAVLFIHRNLTVISCVLYIPAPYPLPFVILGTIQWGCAFFSVMVQKELLSFGNSSFFGSVFHKLPVLSFCVSQWAPLLFFGNGAAIFSVPGQKLPSFNRRLHFLSFTRFVIPTGLCR